MKPAEVLQFAKEKNIQMVDLRFIDWPGMWQHFSVPISELDAGSFESGFGFDGSSIRGWQAINVSDMLVMPDPARVWIDPFYKHPTLVMICDIVDPITHESYSRDPRHIAKKAIEYMKSTGIADTANYGPEAEFFIFNSVRYENTYNVSYSEIDSVEGHWNTGKEENPNLGYKPRHKEGYFPVPPSDTLQDIRTEMALKMQDAGILIECQHHEVATAGQGEIDMRFTDMISCADNLCWFKYIIKNVARQHGMTATFMPKPMYGDNGSGMHTHISLWKDQKPLMAGDGYAGLSETGLYFIGGILNHADSILAFSNPTVNSYKRLVPGFEAPVNLAYSSRNRSAAVRIPMYSPSPKAKRVEFRSPDPACNPYLAFAAMLMAGLNGIQNKMDPGEPLDKNTYDLTPEEKQGVPSVPGSLGEALDALEKDKAYLEKGDVFTPDAIDMWLEYKRENEVAVLAQRPHPMEFELYYDI